MATELYCGCKNSQRLKNIQRSIRKRKGNLQMTQTKDKQGKFIVRFFKRHGNGFAS